MTPDRSALNAAAQRAAREAAKAKASQPPPLNPPFPYRTRPFDPAYFGVEQDPVAPVDSPAQTNPTNG